ncbi:hypothetical protein EZV62_025624 [Acer yangbiense]|uniref:DC1 domain-containing protein n=1 Tax=Acer yangbiense TaxID=1000413 RepID=A0A5C7GYY8_9ROSI|nr:hypothetical protein EZV62_025624 [Acer yangbiense]
MEEEILCPKDHSHVIELTSRHTLYECDGCKYVGFGSSFRCEQCDLDFDEELAHTSHDFFKYNLFKFFPKLPNDHSKFCAGCGRLVNRFVYYCAELKDYLHPCCHSLPSKFKFYHVEFRLRDRSNTSVCLWCKKSKLQGITYGIKGWSYVSKCNKYNFHVGCATRMMLQQGKERFNLRNSLEQSFYGLLETYIGGILRRERRRNIVMRFVITNLVLEAL